MTLWCNTLYEKPLKLKKWPIVAHIHKLKKPRKCIIFRTVIVLSRDKQDLTLTQSCECHVKTHPWTWSLSPTSDQTEPLWTSSRMLLQNAIHNLCCWYWPYLRIVREYNNSVEAANELATSCTLCQHFLQIFSCVNVASFSHIISSLILQTILQTIPITLLGAQTCNALLLLLTLLSIISWKFYFLDSFIIKVYYLVLFGYNQTISILQN